MKSKEFEELKTKKLNELIKLLNEKRVELTKITSKMYAGREKNLKKGKMLRREIAQIMTVKGQIKK
jgi:ribosomal protein L29